VSYIIEGYARLAILAYLCQPCIVHVGILPILALGVTRRAEEADAVIVKERGA